MYAGAPVARPACRVPPSAGYASLWRGILAGWHRRVGLRADPPAQGVGYRSLSADDDLPVTPPLCRLRPVAQPLWLDWPAGQHCLCRAMVMPMHNECLRVFPLAGCVCLPWCGIRDALKSTVLVFRPSREGPRGSAGPGPYHHACSSLWWETGPVCMRPRICAGAERVRRTLLLCRRESGERYCRGTGRHRRLRAAPPPDELKLGATHPGGTAQYHTVSWLARLLPSALHAHEAAARQAASCALSMRVGSVATYPK